MLHWTSEGQGLDQAVGRELEVTREQRPDTSTDHALRTAAPIFGLRAGGAHAHPGRSRAVAQSRALLTQEAVGELLSLDHRSS